MNKYDTKIHEIASENSTIHELNRRPIRSSFFNFVSIMLDNIPWVVDGFTSKGAYYLILDGTKADLVHIERNLDVSHRDVTRTVQGAANKRSFDFEGNRYKIYRKIK